MKIKKFSEYVKTAQIPYSGLSYVIMPYADDKGYAMIDNALKQVKKNPKTVDTGMWSSTPADDNKHEISDEKGSVMMQDKLKNSDIVFNTGIWTNA